ncbi:hypothetical protein C2S51_021839, partial [Perilla frutescens var. frutescens]
THEDVRLPESVEVSIERISVERQTPPLKAYARKMLRDIGEQASLQILDTILYSRNPIKSFGGFVSYLVNKDYPDQAAAVLSPYKSPSSASPNIARNGEGLQSPLFNLQRTSVQNIRCRLSFEDETLGSRSCLARDVSSLSREHGEMDESMTISPQLSILNKLEYRRLFLLLSYIKGNNWEAVLTVDDANEVLSMKHLSMLEFENNIWDRYGREYCKESDRSQ